MGVSEIFFLNVNVLLKPDGTYVNYKGLKSISEVKHDVNDTSLIL